MMMAAGRRTSEHQAGQGGCPTAECRHVRRQPCIHVQGGRGCARGWPCRWLGLEAHAKLHTGARAGPALGLTRATLQVCWSSLRAANCAHSVLTRLAVRPAVQTTAAAVHERLHASQAPAAAEEWPLCRRICICTPCSSASADSPAATVHSNSTKRGAGRAASLAHGTQPSICSHHGRVHPLNMPFATNGWGGMHCGVASAVPHRCSCCAARSHEHTPRQHQLVHSRQPNCLTTAAALPRRLPRDPSVGPSESQPLVDLGDSTWTLRGAWRSERLMME
jgi:hypothetical protein